MATILEEIVEQTKTDLKKRKRMISLSDLETLPDFERERRSLCESLSQAETVSVIAEIKKASPSKGVIRPDFDPQKIAAQYRKGGAAALSVLTDEPAFQGSLEYLEIASNEVDIPLLRKDFIVDPYQVKEARAYGADAILLIATITDGHQLQELHHAADELGLECLVECYGEEDLQYVDFEQLKILGANNRDLHAFEVDVHRGIALLQSAPEDTVLVSESGLNSAGDLKLLFDEGIDAALIGEHFMRQPDPGQAVKKMLDELEKLINDNNSQQLA
ncbi:MAG TPA: indole-3-glycerol phosphate synthase TrpC [Balneolaceae bacterium]|nr:indole-3-glycerol phosphate synthase TrpC [Balneolaceae bacterium]